MRTVLITGASGFVGGHIAHALKSRGLVVRCLVRQTSRLEHLAPITPDLVFGDVTAPETLAAAVRGVDAIIHCAGLTRARSRIELMRANALGTENLLAACKTHNCEISRVIHISSLAAIGPSAAGRSVTEDTVPRPVSDYGESKLAAQNIAEAAMADLPVSVVVPPPVYGPRDSDFLALFKLVKGGILPLIAGCDRPLSLIFIDDLVDAVGSILCNPKAVGKTYLVEDGAVHTWTSLGRTIGFAMGREPKSLRIPQAAVRTVGLIGDIYSRITGKIPLVNSQKVREILQPAWTCSSQRIREELNICPHYALDLGIRRTLAWYQENNWL